MLLLARQTWRVSSHSNIGQGKAKVARQITKSTLERVVRLTSAAQQEGGFTNIHYCLPIPFVTNARPFLMQVGPY